MEFTSLQFFVFIVVSLSANYSFRKILIWPFIMLSINMTFLSSLIGGYSHTIIPFLLYVIVGYIFIRIITTYKKKIILAFEIFILIISFIYIKQYSVIKVLHLPSYTFFTIGFSYVLFRIIQVLIDVYGSSIKETVSFTQYMNYLFFFLNFISGPIQRYNDFKVQHENIADIKLTDESIQCAFNRIVNGYLKIMLIAEVIHIIHKKYGVEFAIRHNSNGNCFLLAWYSVAVLIFTFYIYYNFSGYMDIVIGIGKLFCLNIPENFNKPFNAKNILDFWSRWHITLSDWFRIYLFNPILKLCMKNCNFSVNCLGTIAFFITFFIMGVWHGTTVMFIIYGLFLGFGVSTNKLFQVSMQNRLGKKIYKTLRENIIYQSFCRGMTISYFSLSLTCLWLDIMQINKIFGIQFCMIVPTSFIIIAVMIGILSYVQILFQRKWILFLDRKRFVKCTPLFVKYSPLLYYWKVAFKMIVLYYTIIGVLNDVPEFVYKGY